MVMECPHPQQTRYGARELPQTHPAENEFRLYIAARKANNCQNDFPDTCSPPVGFWTPVAFHCQCGCSSSSQSRCKQFSVDITSQFLRRLPHTFGYKTVLIRQLCTKSCMLPVFSINIVVEISFIIHPLLIIAPAVQHSITNCFVRCI